VPVGVVRDLWVLCGLGISMDSESARPRTALKSMHVYGNWNVPVIITSLDHPSLRESRTPFISIQCSALGSKLYET
jgi:hypothetical protein